MFFTPGYELLTIPSPHSGSALSNRNPSLSNPEERTPNSDAHNDAANSEREKEHGDNGYETRGTEKHREGLDASTVNFAVVRLGV
jgi:hypothetical protein